MMLKSRIFTILRTRHTIPLINSKMKMFISAEKTCHRYNRKSIEMYESILVKHLDIDLSEASNIIKKNNRVLQVSPDQIIQCCLILENYKIDVHNLLKYGDLLKVHPSVLEQRILVLLETGMPAVTLDLLGNFLNAMKISVYLFKAYANIDSTVNISENLFKCLHEPWHEVPPMDKLSEDMPFNEYRLRCLEHYLCWIFELQEEKIREKCNYLQLQYKSFKLFKGTLTLLQNKIGFNNTNIDKLAYLVRCNSKHIEELLKRVKDVSDINITKLIRKYPRILDTDIENIISILKLLKEYNVSNSVIEQCPEICLLPSETLSKNLKIFKERPAFSVPQNHLQILQSIIFHNLHQAHMKFITENNMKLIPFPVLMKYSVKSHERNNTRKPKTGFSNVIGFLKQELQQDGKEIRRKIGRHPFWHYIPLTMVEDTVQFLKVTGFSIDDIYKNVYITLYPRYKVKNVLNIIKEENCYEKWTAAQYLALCLYEMEREVHFTGDGVWSRSIDKYDDLPELTESHEEKIEKDYSESIELGKKRLENDKIMNSNLLSSC